MFDDTRFTVRSCDPAYIHAELNSDLAEIPTWPQADKLAYSWVWMSKKKKKTSTFLLVSIEQAG